MDEKRLAYDILCALCDSSLSDELVLYKQHVQEDLKLTDEQMNTYYNLSTLVSLLQPVKPQPKFYKGKVVNQPSENTWSKVFSLIKEQKLEPVPEEPKNTFETEEKFLLLKKYFEEHGKEPVKNEKYEGQKIFRIYKEYHKNQDAMKILNSLRSIVLSTSAIETISEVHQEDTPDVSDIEN